MWGKRTRFVVYLAVWGVVGIALLAVPALVSPIAENTLMTNPSTNTVYPTTQKTNITTSFPMKGSAPNSTLTLYFNSDSNVTVYSVSAANITFTSLGSTTRAVTIASTAPANVTIASPPQTSGPMALNFSDFALRLSLGLALAVLLSSFVMVRTRRRFRESLEFSFD